MTVRPKLVAVAVTAAALVAGLATPADALISSTRAECWSTPTTVSTWKVDSTLSGGLHKVGDARLRTCTAWQSDEGTFTQYWTEAHRDNGGSLRVGLSFYYGAPSWGENSVSAWGSGTDWNASPALGKEVSDNVSQIIPWVGDNFRLYQ